MVGNAVKMNVPTEQAAGARARHHNLFVGRDHQLAMLRDALAHRASSVLISGPLGSGKSRLIKEAATAQTQQLVFAAHIWSRSMQPGLEPWAQLVEQLDTALVNAGIAPQPAVPLHDAAKFAAHFATAADGLHLQTGRPIAVVVECLHLADLTTLEILRRVAQHGCAASIVATARTDVPLGPERRDALAAFATDAEHLELGPLDRCAIEMWANSEGPGAVDLDLLFEATGGIPLLLEAELSGSPSPRHRVQRAVKQILGSLSAGDRTVAEAASIEPEIDVILLEDLLGQPAHGVDESLARLTERGLLVRDRVKVSGYRFPHDLQRRAVVDTIDLGERARLHWAIAHALERRHGTSPSVVHRVARHAKAGIDAGDPAIAIARLHQSAQASEASWDLKAAETALASAFEIARTLPSGGAKRREILGALVMNRHHRCAATAEDTARMLAADARRASDPNAAAIAAIAMARLPIGLACFTGGDPSVVKMQRAAFDQLGDTADQQLRARLACSLLVNGEARLSANERLALLQIVRDCAARESSPATSAILELAEAALDHGPIKAVPTEDLVPSPDTTLSSDLAIGLFLRDALRLLRRGRFTELGPALAAVADGAELTPLRWAVTRLRRALALAHGDNDQAVVLGGELRQIAAGTTLISFCMNDERAIGTSQTSTPENSAPLPGYTTTPATSALAYLPHRARQAAHAQASQPDHARDLLASVMSHDAGSMLSSRHRVPTFAYLGQCAAALGDRRSCERVIEALLPFADEWVVIANGALINGPVASIIADAAQAVGAKELADEMRLKAPSQRCRQRPSSPQKSTAPRPTTSPARRELNPAIDRRTWQLTFEGGTIEVPASRGLELLARLLEHGELAIPAAALEADQSVDAYVERAHRLRNLRDEIDSAADHNDDARRTLLQCEFDTLLDELVRCESGDEDGNRERARIRVTKALRSTLRRLSTPHPEIGEHLLATIETGRLCRYTGAHSWTVTRTS